MIELCEIKREMLWNVPTIAAFQKGKAAFDRVRVRFNVAVVAVIFPDPVIHRAVFMRVSNWLVPAERVRNNERFPFVVLWNSLVDSWWSRVRAPSNACFRLAGRVKARQSCSSLYPVGPACRTRCGSSRPHTSRPLRQRQKVSWRTLDRRSAWRIRCVTKNAVL
jgi:hypothetical protein